MHFPSVGLLAPSILLVALTTSSARADSCWVLTSPFPEEKIPTRICVSAVELIPGIPGVATLVVDGKSRQAQITTGNRWHAGEITLVQEPELLSSEIPQHWSVTGILARVPTLDEPSIEFDNVVLEYTQEESHHSTGTYMEYFGFIKSYEKENP